MYNKKIEDVFNEVLTGDVLKNALDFARFLSANGIIQADEHSMHYMGKCVCYLDTRSKKHSWKVWTEGDYSNEHEGFPIDERTKEIAWANVMKCGNCKGVDCIGTTKTIFGKEFANICNADNVNMTFEFTNPDAEILECVKKLVLIRKSVIANQAEGEMITTNYLEALKQRNIDFASIKVVMISEVPPQNVDDDFYSNAPNPDYVKSTIGLFQEAGVNVNTIQDILDLGIYITTAVKSPKTSYTVDGDVIKAQLPILEEELTAFPNLQAIFLAGDVAKKAVNMIVKARTKKNVIPSGSTCRIRHKEFWWGGIRVFPSYIITGKNLLIEKGKCGMITEDIRRMMQHLKKEN